MEIGDRVTNEQWGADNNNYNGNNRDDDMNNKSSLAALVALRFLSDTKMSVILTK